VARFALKFPYFIIVCCLMICVIGATSLFRMPVDLFPEVKIPVVVVATFYPGMPAEEIENDITGRFERYFTLGSGIDHIESSSLPGVSLIKVYFQPGTDADAAVTSISNLAMADLRRLPQGTFPPVVLKFDASSLPVCLITLKAPDLTEAKLHDLGQYDVRNQVANVPGASVPQPFGGKYRQIMIYVDPEKLEAHQLSVMDVVRNVNEANLILPSGDAKIGPYDYNIFTNSQIDHIKAMDDIPLKAIDGSVVTVGDVGHAEDAAQIQTNAVRVDGQPSVYLPVLKQGGDSNTISIVDGIKAAVANLVDVPKNLVAKVVFDQSTFVKSAIENLIDEGGIGLVLTGLMILIFLGSLRATVGVFLSIPLSVLASFIIFSAGGQTVNSMILGGLALAFSRLIDNSVVVLENIYRHLEEGEPPEVAAELGGREVALPVLAATLATVIVFLPVMFLNGVSKYLFTAVALSVGLSLFASYIVAMTVVPLFCAKYLRVTGHHDGGDDQGVPEKNPGVIGRLNVAFNRWFNARFNTLVVRYDTVVVRMLQRPVRWLIGLSALCAVGIAAGWFLTVSYFPRTDPGQFVISVKAPTGSRLGVTSKLVAEVEGEVRKIVTPDDLDIVVSNIGVAPGFSSIYTSNTGTHTAFVQVGLKADHRVGSYEYMRRVQAALKRDLPEARTYFQSGGLVDAVLNLGLPAPIDIQVSNTNLDEAYKTALDLVAKIHDLPNVADVFIPQDLDAPSFTINIDRERASEVGLSQKEIVGNIITALASNQMIAPSYWVDPKSGNDYLLTVQYAEGQVRTLDDLKAIPIRAAAGKEPTRLDVVATIKPTLAPTVVNHYQLRRVIDIYVATRSEDLGAVSAGIDRALATLHHDPATRVTLRGSVQAMRTSFVSFGLGLILSVVLVYLILVAQFRSFIDPAIILLAVPPGVAGAVLMLLATGTTVNVMSLMGLVMMVGIVVSNSILIVEFAHRLREEGLEPLVAVARSCQVRLRPILMTSLATLIGLVPMALALGAGSEAYASLARVIIGGLGVSLVLTMFIVPACFLIIHRNSKPHPRVRGAAA
jgi:multidrug efflux pump subunit AcrB